MASAKRGTGNSKTSIVKPTAVRPRVNKTNALGLSKSSRNTLSQAAEVSKGLRGNARKQANYNIYTAIKDTDIESRRQEYWREFENQFGSIIVEDYERISSDAVEAVFIQLALEMYSVEDAVYAAIDVLGEYEEDIWNTYKTPVLYEEELATETLDMLNEQISQITTYYNVRDALGRFTKQT